MKITLTIAMLLLLPCLLWSQADFGDAPDGTVWWGGTAAFKTLDASTGPKHISANTSSFWIGGLGTKGTCTTTMENDALVVNNDVDDGAPRIFLMLIGVPAPANITIPISTSSTHNPTTAIYINVAIDVDNDLDFNDSPDLNWVVRNKVVYVPADTTLGFDFGPFSFGNDLVLLPVWVRITVTDEPVSSPWNGLGKSGGWTVGETEDWWFGIGSSSGQRSRSAAIAPSGTVTHPLPPASKVAPAKSIHLLQPQKVYVQCEQTKCFRLGVKDMGDSPVSNINMSFNLLRGTPLGSGPTITGTPNKIGNTTWFNICVTGWSCTEPPENRFAQYQIKVTYDPDGLYVTKEFDISFGNNQSPYGIDENENPHNWVAAEPFDTTGNSPWYVNQGMEIRKLLTTWSGKYPDNSPWLANGDPQLTPINLPPWASFNETNRSDDGTSATYTFQGTPNSNFNGLTYLDLEVSSTDPTDNVDPWIWKIPIYITDNNLLPNLTKEFGAAYDVNVFKNQSILTSMKAIDQDITLGKPDSTFYDFYLWDTDKNQYHDIPSATFTIQGDSALFNWIPTINDVGNYKLVGQAWDYYMKMDTCKSDVSVYYMKPDFTSTCPVGFAPHSVTFSDKSIAENTTITQYKWSFDDGSFSSERNPTHTFTNSGTYTVSLEIYNGISRVEERKFFYVVVNSIDFKADTTVGNVPFEVAFRNLSTTELPLSITSNTTTSAEFTWLWDLGDGKTTQEKEPLYTYNDPGIFTVSLTGIIYYTYPINDSTTKTDTIVSHKKIKTDYITAIGDLMANFEADVTDGYAPLKVTFTDKSTGSPTAWLWTFGDGSPDDTTQNPVHTYTTPGVYNVSLTVYRGELQNKKQVSQMINVRQPLKAAFSASPTTGIAPLLVTFTNESLGDPPIAASYWEFGDGATSTEKDPIHLYNNAGSYNVTLIVDNTDKRDTLTKNNYIVVSSSGLKADFTAEPTTGDAPLTVSFTDLSTGNPTDWRWYFGFNNETSADRNPVFTYQNSGTYTVTLIVSKGTEVDTTIKEDYIIVGGTGIKEMMENGFELFQNYPNPLRHSTTINFTLNYSSQITLRVFNVLGEEVKTFFNGQRHAAGHYFVNWDGKDNTGQLLPAGIYYYELTLEGSQYRVGKTREMIIVK